ncbi:F-actin-capping protein subunit alpha [Sistotremastrum niveocremeum HHB9708]|uniref:F-actin-capping protein subunit alpha n=1 Tax=Sistotremastrum niveocremeum HHB9708 TaxID=1314777 RepID=A0A164UV57_9AGAM|nr:F-actin-capping protein subunit alpha [Sistotremastrum niveocremeum HHB9708]
MDHQTRIEAASKFLLQAPPGEINDVLNDVRMIINDDGSLQEGILPVLHEYNVTQFITTEVPGVEHQVIISNASKVSQEEGFDQDTSRFVDPQSSKSFAFDHLRLEASDLQPFEFFAETEPLRTALQTATTNYVKDHFHDAVSAVLPSPLASSSSEEGPKKFIIQIVGNKYNPSNFWAGRWRSSYTLDTESGELTGKIDVTVHYYEQGNVQLASSHAPSISLRASLASSCTQPSNAIKILALIGDVEKKYQESLADAYHLMGDKTFKNLRRALPLTRQKIDWDKVTGYKLGAELNASRTGLNPSD